MTEEQHGAASYGAIQPTDGTQNSGDSQAKKRRLIIIGASIAAAVVILIVILSLVFTLGKKSCQLVDEPPEPDSLLPAPIRSQNNKVLMRFSGYLLFAVDHPGQFNDYKYLPLKTRRVHHSTDGYDAQVVHNYITIYTDCAAISLQVDKNTESKTYEVKKIMLSPTSSSVKFESCQNNIYGITFGLQSYYQCHRTVQFNCPYATVGQIHQVTLSMNVLDLELDGDPIYVAAGKFDKWPSGCAN